MKEPITKELRQMVYTLAVKNILRKADYDELLAISDRIEVAHMTRMDDCRRNVRREAVRYIRGVLTDYDHGIRRVRKGDKTEVVRCKDCKWSSAREDGYRCRCRDVSQAMVSGDYYCADGERMEVEDG